MEDFSDFSDQSSAICQLWNKYKQSEQTLHQIDQSCRPFALIKQCINSDTTVQDLEQVCKQYESENWVRQFIKRLSNCTKSSTTTKLDPEKANATLTTCFDDAFLNSFGLKMLLNSLQSLFQSYRAWNLINTFHIPCHEKEIKRIKSKLEKCATICDPLLDLTTLNTQQIEKLQSVQEILNDVKERIETIIDDLKNKIAEAEKHRSNNYVSALMNGFSTLLNVILWNKVAVTTGEYSRSSLTSGASTLIQAGCTLGDLIHAGKANHLIDRLQEILDIMEDLEQEQQELSKQVSATLSNINVHI
jgi:hypothetical protein